MSLPPPFLTWETEAQSDNLLTVSDGAPRCRWVFIVALKTLLSHFTGLHQEDDYPWNLGEKVGLYI